MYIHRVGHYIPEQIIPSDYFLDKSGISEEWILERTGIRERRKAGPTENTNTMGLAAVDAAFSQSAIQTRDIDLIVGATYTPYDTIVSLAHYTQHHIGKANIPVMNISTACSSLVNGFELIEGYFALGKATTALLVCADHNTLYSNETDKISGHLWGDGAVAFIVTKTQIAPTDHQVLEIKTGGAATSGKATEGVRLRPRYEGFSMPNGKDVFMHACEYMTQITHDLLHSNQLAVSNIDYFIPHQANYRISLNVAKQLQLPMEKVLSNIEIYGNTGCAGCGIAYSEHYARFKPNELLVFSVFGGGYSYGGMLVRT